MKGTSGFYNDGSQEPPGLRIVLNLDTLFNLPPESVWMRNSQQQSSERLRMEGFEGVYITANDIALSEKGMPHCGLDRISAPEELASQCFSAASAEAA